MATTKMDTSEPAAAEPGLDAAGLAARSRLTKAVTDLDDAVSALGLDLGGLGGWAEAGPLLSRHAQLKAAVAEIKAAAGG